MRITMPVKNRMEALRGNASSPFKAAHALAQPGDDMTCPAASKPIKVLHDKNNMLRHLSTDGPIPEHLSHLERPKSQFHAIPGEPGEHFFQPIIAEEA